MKLFVNAPNKIKIAACYNILSILYIATLSFYPLFRPLLLIITVFFGIPLAIATYFILRKSKGAFYFLLIWYGLQCFSFNFPNLHFSLYYGFMFYLHIMQSFIGINPIALILFFTLLASKKELSTSN